MSLFYYLTNELLAAVLSALPYTASKAVDLVKIVYLCRELVKIMLFARVSSRNMALGIYLNESVWSSPLVEHNKKQNQRVVYLR